MRAEEVTRGQLVLLRELSNGPERLLSVRVVRIAPPLTTGTVPVLVSHRGGSREWVPVQLLELPSVESGAGDEAS